MSASTISLHFFTASTSRTVALATQYRLSSPVKSKMPPRYSSLSHRARSGCVDGTNVPCLTKCAKTTASAYSSSPPE